MKRTIVGFVKRYLCGAVLFLAASASAATLMTFGGGEMSPMMKYRLDFDKRFMGVETLENMLIAPQGLAFRRPGSYYIAEANETDCRLIKFEASSEDAYIIEMGDNYMRFYRDGGQILDGASAYELDTDIEDDEVWDVQYAQSEDTMYLVDGNDPVQILTRNDHDDWSISDAEFSKGPFNPENPSSTYGADLATDNAKLSVASTGLGAKSYLIDNSRLTGSLWGSAISVPFWMIKYDFGAGNSKTIEKYTLATGPDYEEYMPKGWEFQGSNNDSDWTTLDTINEQTNWEVNEIRSFTFINTTAYRYYRFYLTAHNTSNLVRIYEIEIMEDDDEATNITPSGLQGDITLTASDDLFDEDHVGALWKLIHAPGGQEQAGIVEITAYTSATEVDATVIEPLASTDATERWAEGAWSDYRGYPKTVAFHQQRIVFGGSDSYPQTLWFGGVEIDTYLDFEEGTADANAFIIDLTGQNPIQWMLSQDVLVVGTLGSIGKYGEAGKAVTPDSPYYREQSSHGSESIPAALASDTILYVERGARRIREFSYDLQYDKFISPDLTLLAPHIISDDIEDMAFQLRPNPILWCVLADGDIATLTFQREQSVVGWSTQTTEGDFESVNIIPGDNGEDEVWVAVARTIDSNDVVYIEQFQPQDWGSDPNDMFFVDSGLSYDSTATDDLTGLDHLEGEDVYVFADASYYEAVTVGDVNSGDIALSQTVEVAHAGLGYTSKLITFPFDTSESLGMRKRLSKVWAAFYRMLEDDEGCEYGYNDGTMYYIDFTQYSQNFGDSDDLFTGYRNLDMLSKYDDYDELNIYFRQELPFPMAIQALRAKVEVTED